MQPTAIGRRILTLADSPEIVIFNEAAYTPNDSILTLQASPETILRSPDAQLFDCIPLPR